MRNTIETYKFNDSCWFFHGECHFFIPNWIETTINDFCLCSLQCQKEETRVRSDRRSSPPVKKKTIKQSSRVALTSFPSTTIPNYSVKMINLV
jgi:hypothetical protein